MIRIAPDKSESIINTFKSDWDMMAKSLQIVDKRLILLNPKFVQEVTSKLAPVEDPLRQSEARSSINNTINYGMI